MKDTKVEPQVVKELLRETIRARQMEYLLQKEGLLKRKAQLEKQIEADQAEKGMIDSDLLRLEGAIAGLNEFARPEEPAAPEAPAGAPGPEAGQ